MKDYRFILLVIFTLSASFVFSQNSAEDIFHLSGNLYINGNTKAAKSEVSRGLQLYPNDQKLIALANTIKEEEKKQQDQKQEQQQKQDKEEQKQDNNDQNNESNDQQNQKEEQKKDSPQQQNTEGQITKEDAERILNAIEQQEKELLKEMEMKKANARKEPVEKEW